MGTQLANPMTSHTTVKAREQVVSAKERLDQATSAFVTLAIVAIIIGDTATPVYFGASEESKESYELYFH